jgi:hypothetical protein
VHEANLSLGTEGPALGRAHAYRAAVQRTTLRTLDPGEVAPLELALAWNAFEANVAEALRLIGSPFAAVLTVTDGDRAAGAADRRAACDAARRGDHAAAFLGFTRSAAADPWDEAALAGQAAAWSYLA